MALEKEHEFEMAFSIYWAMVLVTYMITGWGVVYLNWTIQLDTSVQLIDQVFILRAIALLEPTLSNQGF